MIDFFSGLRERYRGPRWIMDIEKTLYFRLNHYNLSFIYRISTVYVPYIYRVSTVIEREKIKKR